MERLMVENKIHKIVQIRDNAGNKYLNYKVFEYCNIIEVMDEVVHPDGKIRVLKQYGIL